jgi:response regulator RpfG family c-di-GMP phosphodiesterase
MLKILLVENDEDLCDVLGFYLESELGAEVEFARTVSQASSFFDSVPEVNCVICGYAFPDGSGEDVIRSLRGRNSAVPFILVGSYHPSNYPTFTDFTVDAYVSKSEVFEKLKGTIEKVLENVKTGSENIQVTDYFRIRTHTILKLGVLTCDFYLRLPQSRYVRVLREGEIFEADDFNRFYEKNVSYLYVKAKDRALFLEKLSQDLLQLSLLKSAPVDTVFQVSTSTLEVIADVTQRFGFTEEAQAVAKANVTLAVKNIQKNPDLAPLFAEFSKNPDSYIASHSVLLAYIACGVASLMGWKSDMTFYKLTLAAFLHDILLKNPRLAEIQTFQELENRREEFEPTEITAFMGHPQDAAQLLRNAKDIPLDVDIIILQHHERPDGKGFPGRLNYMKISPLSAVFVLGHEILRFHQKNPSKTPGSPDVLDFVKGLSVEFQKGYFKSLVHALAESVGKKHHG